MGYPVDRTEFTLRLVETAQHWLAEVHAELRRNGAHGNPQQQLWKLGMARGAVVEVRDAVRRTIAGVDQPPRV